MAKEKRDIIHMSLKDGVVVIETKPDLAPKHVNQIKKLIEEGQYDGVVFHRVIKGFMAQTGDVEFGNSTNDNFNLSRAGTGGSNLPDISAESAVKSAETYILQRSVLSPKIVRLHDCRNMEDHGAIQEIRGAGERPSRFVNFLPMSKNMLLNPLRTTASVTPPDRSAGTARGAR